MKARHTPDEAAANPAPTEPKTWFHVNVGLVFSVLFDVDEMEDVSLGPSAAIILEPNKNYDT